MNVLIVDDNLDFINKLRKDLFNFFTEYYKDVNFLTYQTLNVSDIQQISVDYVFLDIDLINQNGIELAQEIILMHSNVTLVFVSSHSDLVHNSLIVRPFYFIRKNDYNEDIKTFFKLLNIDKKDRKFIDLKFKGETNRVLLEDIIYIESFVHKMTVHTYESSYHDNRSLAEFVDCLPDDDFIRIHRSYIININNVKKYRQNKVLLATDIELPLGRSYKDDFDIFYMEYLVR